METELVKELIENDLFLEAYEILDEELDTEESKEAKKELRSLQKKNKFETMKACEKLGSSVQTLIEEFKTELESEKKRISEENSDRFGPHDKLEKIMERLEKLDLKNKLEKVI